MCCPILIKKIRGKRKSDIARPHKRFHKRLSDFYSMNDVSKRSYLLKSIIVKNFEETREKKKSKGIVEVNMAKLKSIMVEGEKLFYSLSFDIDDFIGDGIWWLQIYNSNQNLIYDKPFTSSIGSIDKQKITKIIKKKFLTYRGALL